MVLHKAADIGDEYDNPVDVTAYLELGTYRQEQGNYCGPRLVCNGSNGEVLSEVDLLEIRSLEKAKALHLEDFPFAIPGNSLILRRHNAVDSLVLEANTPDITKRVIHGLRWIVARLTFNLIIGNRFVTGELLEFQDEVETGEELKAMNDVTNQLVEKSVFSNPQKTV